MKRLACLFVCAAAVASAHAQGTTEAVLNYGPVPGSSLATGPMDGTVGWTFKTLANIDVVALGSVSTSVANQSPLSIGLWTDAGQLVASNMVTSTSSQVNQSRYTSITPVHLFAGQIYHIGAYSDSGTIDTISTIAPGTEFFNGTVSLADNYIQLLGAAQSQLTSGLRFPGTVAQSSGWIYLGPNFQFTFVTVPEPSSLALLGLGGLALACWRKRR